MENGTSLHGRTVKYGITCLDQARVMVSGPTQGRANALGCGKWPGRSIKTLLQVDHPDPNPPQGSEKEGPPGGPIGCLGNISALDLLGPLLQSACFLGYGTSFQISPCTAWNWRVSSLHPVNSKPLFPHTNSFNV